MRRAAAISAVGLLAALVLAILIVQSSLVRRPLLEWVAGYLAREASLSLTVEEYRYNLLTRRVTARGVTLTALDHETPIFTASEVEVRLPWSAYLGRIWLQVASLDDARVSIVTDANGLSNLPPGDDDAVTPETPRRVDIRGMTIRNLDFEYLNAETDVDVRLGGLNASLVGRAAQAFTGSIGAITIDRGVAVRVGDKTTTSAPVEGQLGFDGSTVSLQDLRLSFPEADVVLSGRVLRALDTSELELRYEGVAQAAPSAAWGPSPIAVGGTARLEGSITGPLDAVVVESAFISDDLAVGAARDLRVEGVARVTNDAVTISPLTLAAGQGQAEATVVVPLDDDLGTTVNAEWNDLPLETVLAIAEQDALPVAALLTGTLAMDLGAGAAPQLTADLVLRTRGVARPGALPLDGRITARVSGGRWRADVDQQVLGAARAVAEIEGAYDEDEAARSTLAGPLDVRITDVPALSRALANAGIELPDIVATSTGEMSAALQLGGRIGAPEATGTVASEGLVLADVGPARLNLSLSASPELIRIEDLRLVASETTVDADVRMDLVSGAIDGDFRFEAPELQQALAMLPEEWRPAGSASGTGTLGGTLEVPAATATVTTGRLTVGVQHVDAIEAELRVSADAVQFDRIEVAQGDGRLEATGRYAWESGAYAVRIDGRSLVVEDALGADGGTRARLDVTFEGEGTVEAPFGDGRATIDLEGGTAGELVGRTTVGVRLDGELARFNAHAPGLGSLVSGTISPQAPYDYRAVVAVNRVDLAPFALLGGAREGAVAGTLSLSALVTGAARDPESLEAAINLQGLDVQANGVPVTLAGPARLRWATAGLEADDLRVQVGSGELRASGRFADEVASEWRMALEADAAELVTMAQSFAAVPAALAARGAVLLDWTSTGGTAATDGTLTLSAGELTWGDLPPVEAVTVRATFDGAIVDVPEMTGTWQGGGIDASARLPRALFEEGATAGGDGQGFVKARLSGLAPGALAPWMDEATVARMTGRLSATLDAVVEAPTLSGLRGTLLLDEATLTVDGVPIEQRQPSRLTLAGGELRMADVQWIAGGSPLQLTGAVDLNADDPALDLELTGRADLRIASAFDPTIATDGGADLDVRIGGTASVPLLEGRVTLDGVEMAMRDPQIILSDVRGVIDLAGDRIVFQEVTGEANGGRMVLVGGLVHSGFELTGGTMVLQLQGAAIEYPEGLQSEADALLQFSPGPGDPRLFGDVRILRSGYLAPISLPALVAANRAQARPIRAEPSYIDTIRLNIALETVTDMVVDNNYGRFEAGAQVRVVGTMLTPGLVGRAELREGGQMFLAGNTFRIERGSISFIGQSTIEPDFDIEVRTMASGQDVTVTLSGTLDRLETDVRSSNPDVATDELVSLLLGGTGAGFGGTDALRLFSAELLGATGRAFGLDSLRLERGLADEELRADPGQISDQTDPSARLTLSKRLRPDVEVILSQNLREAGLSAILSYRPRRNVELRGISRDNQDRSYSLRHEITFGGGGIVSGAEAVPEARVSAVNVTGGRAGEADLRERLRLGEGDRFNFHTWQRDIDTLRTRFQEAGRLEVRVRATRQEDENAGTVALNYRVEPGPRTTLAFVGYEVPDRLRRELEEAWARAVFDQFLIQDLELRVRRHLIERGFFGGAVDVAIETPEEDLKVVRLTIDPGTQVSDHEIRFEGREAIDEGLLRAAIEAADLETEAWITPARLRQPLEDTYAVEGFLDAQVQVGSPEREGDRAVLRVAIDEGPRYSVGSVSFEGVADQRLAMVQADARLDEEDPYTSDVIERARRRVEDGYLRFGFNAVRIDVRPVLDETNARVEVAFLVEEGPQQVLAEVTTSGATRTREGVVERALRLRVGEPVDLNEWALGRKRLYDTNVFRQVDLQAQPIGDPVDGIEQVRAQVTVQEWPAWRFRYGLQWNDERVSDEEESFRAIEEAGGRKQTIGVVGDLRSQNLFGRALGAGVTGRVEPSRQLASTYVSVPSFFRLPVTTNLFVFGERQTYDVADTLSFLNDRTGASLEQRWRRTRATQVAWSYRFERSHTYDPDPDPNDEFPLDFMADVARLSLTALVDRRDDPFNSRRGWFSSVAFEYAAPEIGSDLRLAKLFAQQKLFRPVGPVVLAGALQVGAAFAADLIPSERFRAGGGYTVRGFAEDGLGPLDFLGRPRGGNALLVVNQEVRFPVFRWVRGVAFFDMGNVFAGREDLSFNNLKVGYGFGLRLDTPFALVRIDYGIPTDRRPGDPHGRWYFGIGQVF